MKTIIHLFFASLFFFGCNTQKEKHSTSLKAEEVSNPINKTLKHTLVHNGQQAGQVINTAQLGEGTLVDFELEKATDEQTFNLGKINELKQFTGSYRHKSCWMNAKTGVSLKELPIETQFLLTDQGKGTYLMLIPLVGEKARCSFSGNENAELELIVETGDTLTHVKQFKGFYVLKGENPQDMIAQAMKEIQSDLKTFELRSQKNTPWFADYFGWCTWNALGHNLSNDTLVYAAETFKQSKIPVKYFLIDDGWQASNGRLLGAYSADKQKFPNGISETVNTLKSEYGLDKVLIWQALWGKFRGIDPKAFPEIATDVSFMPPKRMSYLLDKKKQTKSTTYEATVGPRFYPPFFGKRMTIPQFSPFFEQYFSYLKQQGIDGVKVDAMTWVEATGNNRGGRVTVMKEMMEGLQKASNKHFNNEMINCSSLSNDYLFNTVSSNVTRTSTDFFPDKPASHGEHIFINAHTSFWLGEVVLPDWDMFQSGHENGAFHAGARAISGGPIYTTEKIGSENKEVLMKLMTEEGRLPRAKTHGRVCTSSLFVSPTANDSAIKIFNTNLKGGVIGAFNCSYDATEDIIVKATISSKDIEGIEGDNFAVYQHSTGKVFTQAKNDKLDITIKELDFDLFTYVSIDEGFAPLGITDKYNPAGMLLTCNLTPDAVAMDVMGGGNFVAYADTKPKEVFVNNKSIDFEYNGDSKVLKFFVPLKGQASIVVKRNKTI